MGKNRQRNQPIAKLQPDRRMTIIEINASTIREESPSTSRDGADSHERYVGSRAELEKKPTLASVPTPQAFDVSSEREYALFARTAEVELLTQENKRLRQGLEQIREYIDALLTR